MEEEGSKSFGFHIYASELKILELVHKFFVSDALLGNARPYFVEAVVTRDFNDESPVKEEKSKGI